MLKTSERIVSLTALQRKASSVVANARVEPVTVTSRGKPVAVLIGVGLFDRIRESWADLEAREMSLAVALSEAQFKAGETVTLEDLEREAGTEP